MTILTILEFPDERLRKKALPVVVFDDALGVFVDDMLETMYAAPGVGLAANQVNVQKQIIVIDISDEKNAPVCLINPVLIEKSGMEEMDEGCLSVPGIYEKVGRANSVVVKAQDRFGQPFEMNADGLLAVCVQHEIDHLEGKLFVDYLSPLKRQLVRKKLKKSQKSRTAQSSARAGAAI